MFLSVIYLRRAVGALARRVNRVGRMAEKFIAKWNAEFPGNAVAEADATYVEPATIAAEGVTAGDKFAETFK